jgi:hypothetical protein
MLHRERSVEPSDGEGDAAYVIALLGKFLFIRL